MPKRVKFEPRWEESSQCWVLNVPAAQSPTHKRMRLHFADRKDALAKAEALRQRVSQNNEMSNTNDCICATTPHGQRQKIATSGDRKTIEVSVRVEFKRTKRGVSMAACKHPLFLYTKKLTMRKLFVFVVSQKA